MQKRTKVLMEKIGIKELFEVPHGKLQGSTVLATNGKENLAVSQMLKSAAYLIKFRKCDRILFQGRNKRRLPDIRMKNVR